MDIPATLDSYVRKIFALQSELDAALARIEQLQAELAEKEERGDQQVVEQT